MEIEYLGKSDIPLETKIFKYYTIESFLFLIESNALLFQPIEYWKDIAEGSLYGVLKRNGYPGTGEEKIRLFGSCWTLHDCYELNGQVEKMRKARIELEKQGSSLMWDSYCPNSGIRIETTIKQVIGTMFENDISGRLVHGKVYYNPDEYYDEVIDEPLERLIFRKRYSYHSENEYRFIIMTENAERKLLLRKRNICECINRILISPNGSKNEWISQVLYKMIYFNITKDVTISQLYGNISEEI